MPTQEREVYVNNVKEWLQRESGWLEEKAQGHEARFQNILLLSGSWNETQCRAFEEGVRLMSALVSKADTWLPAMFYVKAARRVILRVIALLSDIEQADVVRIEPRATSVHVGAGNTSVTQIPANQMPAAEPVLQDEKPLQSGVKAVPMRPRHIDQYVHLLPEKTQQRAAEVKGLLRELDDAREKARLLMESKNAKGDDLAAWAKAATAADKKVKDIYRELDREWDKLVEQGRVEVDDLGNARVLDVPADGEAKSQEEQKPQELTPEQKTRRRQLRKTLSETRYGNGDTREEHVKKWRALFEEYLTLEGEKAFEDKKIGEAAGHYGISLEDFKDKDKKEG